MVIFIGYWEKKKSWGKANKKSYNAYMQTSNKEYKKSISLFLICQANIINLFHDVYIQ